MRQNQPMPMYKFARLGIRIDWPLFILIIIMSFMGLFI